MEADVVTVSVVIPDAAQRRSGIQKHAGLCLWIPGSLASLAPRNDCSARTKISP